MASVTLTSITVTCIIGILSPIHASGDSLQEILFNGNYKFIDLTHTFNNKTIYWPGAQKFRFTKNVIQEEGPNSYWYASNDFTAGEHGGTHIDAPYHFYKPGKYVAELTLEKLIVPLKIVDVSAKVNGNPDYLLLKKDLSDIVNDSNFTKPCVIIFKFGWSQYFINDPQKYLGINGEKLRFPGITAEVAEWVVSLKTVVGVGVDAPSVDAGFDNTFPVHKILSMAGLYNLENVKLDNTISVSKCTALVLPMKIGKGTGAPLRLVAICPKEIV